MQLKADDQERKKAIVANIVERRERLLRKQFLPSPRDFLVACLQCDYFLDRRYFMVMYWDGPPSPSQSGCSLGQFINDPPGSEQQLGCPSE